MTRALLLALLLCASPSFAATFTVDSTGDEPDADVSDFDGICATEGEDCTLRAAIQEANAQPGADTIVLPAGTIVLGSALPDWEESATLDGCSAAGAARNDAASGTAPTVTAIIQGDPTLSRGLALTGSGQTYLVQCIGVTGFSTTTPGVATAIVIDGGAAATLEANVIDGNGGGVLVNSAAGVTIGGTSTGDGNAITDTGIDGITGASGATAGLVIQGNIIDGAEDGIYLNGCANVQVGGDSAGARNIIRNHDHIGVSVQGCSGSTIEGNTITDNGTADGNHSGVLIGVIAPTSDVTVSGNTIGGNSKYGVEVGPDGLSTTITDNTDGGDCNAFGGIGDAGTSTTDTNNNFCDPTPTPTIPLGCCNLTGIEGVTCFDQGINEGVAPTSQQDCQDIVGGFGGTATNFNPDAVCDPNAFGGTCADPAADTPTATATATHTPTATGTDTPSTTATVTATATATSTATGTATPTSDPNATPTWTPAVRWRAPGVPPTWAAPQPTILWGGRR